MEEVLQTLCEQMVGKGVQSDVVVANTSARTVTETINGINVTRVASVSRMRSVSICPTMPLVLRRKSYDIIVIHHPNPMADVSYLLGRPRGKLIIMHHSDVIKQKLAFRYYKGVLNRVLKKADCIVATAKNNIKYSHTLLPFEDKCSVVPLGLDIRKFELTEQVKSESEKLREKFGKKIVLFVGRLVYYKGVEVLIRAAVNFDAKVLIVGTGPLENKLKALAASLGIGDRIIFLGRAESLAPLYYASDVFVLPSVERSEAFGVVQLEAMVCGVPVVSTDLPSGVPEVNRNGITGIVVKPGDEKELSSAISKILGDPELRAKFGSNGKKIVAEEHTHEIMAERFYKVMCDVLEGRKI